MIEVTFIRGLEQINKITSSMESTADETKNY